MTKKLTKEEKAANLAARRAARGGVAGKPKPAKAAKPAKESKKTSSKVTPLRASKEAAGVGHNAGKVNEALVAIFTDYRKLDEDAKAISKAKRDLRAKAKEEHNVAAANFNHEIKLQKLENDQRVMFEAGAKDLKDMLGIQLSLELLGGGDDDDNEGEEDEGNTPDPVAAARRAADLH